jgi:hypothetical protein
LASNNGKWVSPKPASFLSPFAPSALHPRTPDTLSIRCQYIQDERTSEKDRSRHHGTPLPRWCRTSHFHFARRIGQANIGSRQLDRNEHQMLPGRRSASTNNAPISLHACLNSAMLSTHLAHRYIYTSIPGKQSSTSTTHPSCILWQIPAYNVVQGR